MKLFAGIIILHDKRQHGKTSTVSTTVNRVNVKAALYMAPQAVAAMGAGDGHSTSQLHFASVNHAVSRLASRCRPCVVSTRLRDEGRAQLLKFRCPRPRPRGLNFLNFAPALRAGYWPLTSYGWNFLRVGPPCTCPPPRSHLLRVAETFEFSCSRAQHGSLPKRSLRHCWQCRKPTWGRAASSSHLP